MADIRAALPPAQPLPCAAHAFIDYEDEGDFNVFTMHAHCCPNADVLDASWKSLKDFGWLKGWLETNKMTFYRGKDKSCL